MPDSSKNKPPRVFILRSRIGRRIFTLKDDVLEVSVTSLDRRSEAVIPLRRISPDYEVGAARNNSAIAILLIPGVLLGYFAWFLLSQDRIPRYLAIYPIIFGGAFITAAVQLIPRFEYFVFKDHWNRPLFTILRERGQTAECEAFIHAILDSVEGIEPTTSCADEAFAEPPAQYWWIFAIVAGLGAVVVHVLASRNALVAFYYVPFVVLASGGGISAAIGSFLTKERQKWWSLIGLVLSAIPMALH